MSWFTDPNAWAALAALTSIEIVLGIDNIIFITILVGRLPEEKRQQARTWGLLLAMATRLLLLFSLTWFMRLSGELFAVFGYSISVRDLILIAGGLFLLAKATFEIHGKLEGGGHGPKGSATAGFAAVLVQIAILDIVFSIDSVITAIGLAEELMVMVIAVVTAVFVMLVSAKPIGDFVDRHPTLKMLALSFLLLIGTTLVADGLGFHFPKGYVYFAMAFSAFVEMLNLRLRKVSRRPSY
ncbi:MAG: TerC family protein [Thermoanaerobaculia bacterium]|nr:TerC family protein [Thermoanaerobaculia bacterium]